MAKIDQLTNITVHNVTITFKPAEQHGRQEGIVFDLPASSTPEMIQTYLDQYIVPYLPFGNKSAYNDDLIGENCDAITDIYLTFDGTESDPDKFHLSDRSIKPIKFNSVAAAEYKQKCKPIMLKQLKFTVSFSQFTLKDVEEEDINSARAIKSLVTQQFQSFIESSQNPILNLRIQDVECGKVDTIDEDYASDRGLSYSRLSPIDGFKDVRLPHYIEVNNNTQYCFMVRSVSKKTIDLCFYTEKILIRNQKLICSDLGIGRNTFYKILELGTGESVKFKYGVVIKYQ